MLLYSFDFYYLITLLTFIIAIVSVIILYSDLYALYRDIYTVMKREGKSWKGKGRKPFI